MNQYEFQKITRQMEQKYGKIRKGEEDAHAMMLFPMESNLLKAHRSNPASNSRKTPDFFGNCVFYFFRYFEIPTNRLGVNWG